MELDESHAATKIADRVTISLDDGTVLGLDVTPRSAGVKGILEQIPQAPAADYGLTGCGRPVVIAKSFGAAKGEPH